MRRWDVCWFCGRSLTVLNLAHLAEGMAWRSKGSFQEEGGALRPKESGRDVLWLRPFPSSCTWQVFICLTLSMPVHHLKDSFPHRRFFLCVYIKIHLWIKPSETQHTAFWVPLQPPNSFTTRLMAWSLTHLSAGERQGHTCSGHTLVHTLYLPQGRYSDRPRKSPSWGLRFPWYWYCLALA